MEQTNSIMKTLKTLTALAVGLAATTSVNRAALIQLDLKNIDNQKIEVNGNGVSGGSFDFTSDIVTGLQWHIDGTLYDGNFGSLPFYYGSVSSSVSLAPPFITTAWASVIPTFSQNFMIKGQEGYLKGMVTWDQIFTVKIPGGPILSGVLSVGPTANLNNLSYVYTGSTTADPLKDQLLKSMDAANFAYLNVTFQSLFDLDQIISTQRSTYSGSILFPAIPEPSTFLVGIGALCLWALSEGLSANNKRKVVT